MAILEAYPAPGNPLESLTQWEVMFSRYQWSGVDGTPGGVGLQPSLDTANRAVKVAAGGAMIRGIRWGVDAPEPTPIPAASAQDRIDRLVLRLDRTNSPPAQYVFLKHLPGTSGSSTPPAITQTEDGIWDEYICRWTSSASGALTGLVDERSWMATDGVVPCYSYRRPSSGFGVLIGELDTNVFRVGLGAGQYLTVAEDSGYQAATLDTTHVSQGAAPLEACRLNGAVWLTGSVTSKVARTTEFGVGWLPTGSGVNMSPRKATVINGYGTGGNPIAVTIYASGDRAGQIWVTGNVGQLDIGENLYINASWPGA